MRPRSDMLLRLNMRLKLDMRPRSDMSLELKKRLRLDMYGELYMR